MHCIALFSGSLESLLAVRLMQLQQIAVTGIFFRTLCARRSPPQELADQLGIKLVVVGQDEGYCNAIRHPTLGRTKNAAACLDCRVHQLRTASLEMAVRKAAFVVTGEILGQRPRSQNRPDLESIAYHSGIEHLLVRPLSAKLLDVTRPEQEGWIDREKLHAFQGNSHHGLIELARSLGLGELPASRPGCGLTDGPLSARVFDCFKHSPVAHPGEFELLTVGRHFRIDESTKLIVGRNQLENTQLENSCRTTLARATLFRPSNFQGPIAILIGQLTVASESFAAAIVCRFGKRTVAQPRVLVENGIASREVVAQMMEHAERAIALGSE
jgi:tRNA-specific 2-thiouridylase